MFYLSERYRALGSAVNGGMGTVIFCKDLVLERDVAIKFVQDRSNHRRIFDEIEALMLVRSKHVVQVYDFLSVEGYGLGIVQEYIEGLDLFQINTPIKSLREFYLSVWQLASGISDIHHVGVIHRDIKPNNVKIDSEGVLKIFDFGLARNDGKDASTLGFIGTHGFAAPELYRNNAEFTSAVDVYAFGATALYLRFGELPVELMKPYKLSPNFKGDFFSRIDTLIDASLVGLLDSCLNADPRQRPLMRHVRDELSKCILFDLHRALVVYKGQAKNLDKNRRKINLKVDGVGDVDISYDGLRFFVSRVLGEVFINNINVELGYELPGSCVVALGASYRENSERAFITFDLSHPEIVL